MIIELDVVEKINFYGIDGEEGLKEALGISDETLDKLIQAGFDSTDENTPDGLRNTRIMVDVIDKFGDEYVLS